MGERLLCPPPIAHQVLVVQRDQGRQADLVRLAQDARGVGQAVVARYKDVAGLGYWKKYNLAGKIKMICGRGLQYLNSSLNKILELSRFQDFLGAIPKSNIFNGFFGGGLFIYFLESAHLKS